MKIIILLIGSLFVFSASAFANQITERQDEPPIHAVSSSDKEMNEAILKARKTVVVLYEDFDWAKESGYPMAVKVNLTDKDHSEHFWLTKLEYSNGAFEGTLDNNPLYLKQYKMGQRIKVNVNEISDWFLIMGDDIYGAFTMKLARSRMNDIQKEALDKSFPYLKIAEDKGRKD